LEEFVEDGRTGFLVQPNSSKALAEGINKYFILKYKIDFKSNIEKKQSTSLFYKFGDIFEEIILGNTKSQITKNN
jgi:hypothetical protein